MSANRDVPRMFEDVAKMQHELRRRIDKVENAPADLRHAAIDGGKGLVQKDPATGDVVFQIGTDPVTGVTAPEYKGGPAPEQPSVPFVDAGGEAVKIQHSGLDVHENPAPANFRRALVHVSLEETFEPGLSTLAGYMDAADGSFTHRLPGGEWYVGIVWETLSGKHSPMSDTVLADVAPLVDAQDIQDTLDTAQARLDEYRDNVATPRFQALEEGLSESNDNLDDARTRLSAAEQTLSPLPGRIASAEQDVAAAQVEATKAAAAAVEANNRAMTRLANGNFESGLDYWDHDNVSLTGTAHSGQQAALIEGWLRPGSSFPVVPDQIWELSLYHQYDVTVTFETVDGDTRTVLSTHHLDGDSSWSDSGALRVTIPADVHMLSFTILGTSAIVDDITLRDVTDVVRLEEAANANRQKAEQAISELAVMRLAVDGAGGLKDRLDSAEDDLENIDTELDQVATNLTTALTGPVDHTRLRAGEGAFDTGFIGELWAGNIRALAAELARATIAAPNLWPDPDFEQDVYGSWTRVDGGIERNGSESLSVSYVSDDEFYIPIEYDVPYRITVDFSLNGPGRGEVWLRDADANKTYIGSTARSNFRSSSGTFNITYMPSSNSNGQARYMYLGFGTRNTDPSTRLRFENLKIERMTDGSLIVENSVTAEKITATREMVTKIMGAEWAYIAQQLIVDGSILTRDLEALSAAIQSLTVTQRADIAQVFTPELWAALAVVETLQAEEAWITSAMIEELTAEKVTVTQEFVARVAQFLTVRTDMLEANAVTADKIGTDAIEARHIAAKAIEADMIDAGAIRTEHVDAERFVLSSESVDVSTRLSAYGMEVIETWAGYPDPKLEDPDLLTARHWTLDGWKNYQLSDANGNALFPDTRRFTVRFRITVHSMTGLQVRGHGRDKPEQGDAWVTGTWSNTTMPAPGDYYLEMGAHPTRPYFAWLGLYGDVTLREMWFEPRQNITDLPVLSVTKDGLKAWDSNGSETASIGSGGQNFLAGRLFTNSPGQPGVLLNEDYGPNSSQGAGVWLTDDGSAGGAQAAIWATKDRPSGKYTVMNIRGPSSGIIRMRTRTEFDATVDFNGVANVHGYLRNNGIPSTTGSSNVLIGSGGSRAFYEVRSIRDAKVNIEAVDETIAPRILDLQPRDWLDRTDLEERLGDDVKLIEDTDEGPQADESWIETLCDSIPRRVPGLVAEEVRDAGLDGYVTYDKDEHGNETLSGVAYDRLWTLLIPLVREQRDQIRELQEQNADIEQRLARLEENIP